MGTGRISQELAWKELVEYLGTSSIKTRERKIRQDKKLEK
jgi:hypothetical protein